MASSSAAGRRSPTFDRPNMSDLRIVLLGKNVSENSRVGNTILGTTAFDSKTASSYSQQHSVRISGTVEKRHIIIISTPPLLQPNLSQYQITQRVRECASQSAPEPHAILLVLQYNDFSEEDLRRVKYVLNLFSVKAFKHTIVLTTDEQTLTSMITSKLWNNTMGSNIKSAPKTINNITNLIKECGGGHLQFDERNTGWRSEMIRRIDEMLKEEHEEFVICNIDEDGGTSVDEDLSGSGGSFRGDGTKDGKQNTTTANDGGVTTSGKSKLNIVLCGYDTTLKNTVSKILRGTINKQKKPLHQKEKSNVCVKREEKINGRQITVIELPALTRLSEEEVMRETLNCVSLCDPGVDAFVLVTPVGSLTNEDRAEMEKIKRIFNSNEHFMVLFTTDLTVDQSVSDCVLSTESQKVVSLYGSWYSVMRLKDYRNSGQISDLLDCIDSLKTEPYSLQMYLRAPEKRVRDELEEKLSVREKEIKELQEKIKTMVPEGVKLNLVLCGSNRRLKSFISNLILNPRDRRPELSSECVRTDVDLHGRLVSLVELPDLINTQISEEEVMRQTLRCVSLCDPGVHVFLLTIPDAPLNNEDRAEMEKIQKIFSSRINKHIMILIFQSSEEKTAELNEETQSVIKSFGGRHHFICPDTQVSMLMEKLKQMVEENSGVCFSSETLMDVQMEKLQTFEEMKTKIHSLETWFQSKDSRESEDDLRIVLVGKTGVGKSSTGNTILGREAFISDTSHESITKECRRERSEINGRHVTVIDTPGLFDTNLTNEEIQQEIKNCISMILPGPHVFLLLIPVGRFTEEEEKSVKIIQEMFGEKSLMFTIVLFTRGDDLKNKPVEQWLGKPGSVIRKLIEACGNRYHVFNNNQTGDRTQVSDLLKKIDDMVKENGDSYYSCKMFREMEIKIQDQQMKILTEKVEQLKREREELMNKHEEEIKRMKTMMGEETQNHYKERKTREDEFRNREEHYKRDIKERADEERKMREEMKREREEWEKQKQEDKQRRDEEDERRRKSEQAMRDEHNQEIERMKMMIEEERKKREEEDERRRKKEQTMRDEHNQEKERMKTMMEDERKRREEEDEKRRKKEQAMRDEHNQEKERMKMMMEEERKRREEEDERRKKEKQMWDAYNQEKERMKTMMEDERKRREEEDEKRRKKEQEMRDEHNQEKERMKMMMEEERKRREEEDERRRKIEKETWDEYYEKLKRERERIQREKEELQFIHEEEKERMKMKMEKERQNHEKDRKRREEECIRREKNYRRDMEDIEDHEREMREEMRREREEWEKQRQEERQRREETHNTDTHPQDDEDPPSDPGCLRILLFGRTGNGKSATANTILRTDEFHSKASLQLVTTTCQMGDFEVDIGEITSVAVIDTPGLFDTSLTKEQVQEEMMKCVSLSAPGPHVFIIVLSLGRITEEERDTLDVIKRIFGPKAADFSIVLFTKGDTLRGQTIEQYVERSTNAELKKLISDCGNRFLAFNNRETRDRTQVTRLLDMIEEVKKSNEGRHFTNEMFEEAAISIENRREMLEENKIENQDKVKELEARCEMEIRRMRQRLEEKKLKTDEERVRLENKFREKEETLRREFKEKEKSDQKKQEEEEQKRSEEEEQRRAEYDQRREEMEREIENLRLQCEKQLKEREEEDKKREEEYKQNKEKMKTEQKRIMSELRRKQEEEIKKRDLEEQMRKKQEEKEREEWKRKIKETEDDKEIQERIKRQQREWEEEKKQQMREREEEERKIKERHEEQLREKQEELEKMRTRSETEREEERQMIEDERQKHIREREEKEREYEKERKEMKRRYDQFERERKEEWDRRKQEDEERRREKRKRWEKMMKDLKQELEEEIRRREREERKECDEMKQKYEEEIEKMKEKHEDEARRQRKELEDFRKRKDEQVQELKERLEQLYKEKHRSGFNLIKKGFGKMFW